MVRAFMSIQGDDFPQTPPLPRGVRRALEAMRANAGHDWTIADLAEAAGQSGRTLQRQFRAFLGKTPWAVLSDVRFEAARRELLRGLPETKVMDVALRHGFSHYGRFSVEYRRRYDETPSITLKRQLTFADVLAAMPAMAVTSRDRPMVALSPIEAGPHTEQAALGVADELATALGRAGIAVTNDPRSTRYRLGGSLRLAGEQKRLTLRLIDGETGSHLWAHRCDGAFGGEADPAEHVALHIAAALQPCLRRAEIDRAQRKSERDLTAHDLTLRAMPGILSLDADGNARGLDLLERATDRDPHQPLAVALAAWAHVQRVTYHFASNPEQERARSTELARKAQTMADDASALAVLGNAFTLLGDLEAAELVVRKALAMEGGSAWAWSRQGWIDLYKGDICSAIERFKVALDIAPQDSLAFNSMVGIGCAHFDVGRYAEAARWQKRALLEHPSAVWIHRTLCPAYVLGGDHAEAKRSATALRERYPDLTLTEVQQNLPPLSRSYRERISEGLRSVGLPD
jgi:AraC-like DNA-binding protein/tetratricopeptide (TPR) repeat protein